MGIRFRCPNGHKIHVKTYLAGKRGICPKCGVKVPIPLQSEPEFAARSRQKPTAGAPIQPDSPAGSSGDSAATTVTRPESGGPVRPTAEEVASPRAASKEAASEPLTRTREGQPVEAVPDPIAAAPHAKWFVRPPSGGQFGPAPGHVLREWMVEGRVTPDTYIWREGWPEWLLAKKAFGDFDQPTSTASAQPLPAIVTQTAPKSTAELYRRRKSTVMTFTIVGLLGLACAVLFAALVYVVRFMK